MRKPYYDNGLVVAKPDGAPIAASLGLSMNFETVTARYVDARLERKKEVLDTYHSAVKQTATAEKGASAEKKEKPPPETAHMP